MYTTQLLFLAVTLGTARTLSLQTGKCRNNIEPITLNKKMMRGRWNALYITDSEEARQLDHSFVEITQNGSDTYNLVSTDVSKAGEKFTRSYKLTVDNNIITAEFEEDGKVDKKKKYLLKNIDDEAILVYHCSETGVLPSDMRVIEVRDGTLLSNEGLEELMKSDRKYNFIGKFYKLPNQLKTN